MWMRKIIMLLVLLTIVGTMGACGRKNQPVAPDDVDPKYPRTYPAPAPIPSKQN
jgi:predicted small lipoprotein YifL